MRTDPARDGDPCFRLAFNSVVEILHASLISHCRQMLINMSGDDGGDVLRVLMLIIFNIDFLLI